MSWRLSWAKGLQGLVYSERSEYSEAQGRVMRLSANPHEYAWFVATLLRQLDMGVTRIAVERLPDDAAWDAVCAIGSIGRLSAQFAVISAGSSKRIS